MLRGHALLALVLGMLAVAPCAARATVLRVPGEYSTIQAALSAAAEGDTVQVAPSTYIGAGNRNLDFGGTNIKLVSESGYMSTFIDCQGLGRGLYFHGGEDTTSVVEGFTIQNAAADTGAGALCVDGSSPRFEDCVFQLNTATARGGAVACSRSSSPIIRDCTLGGNESTGAAFNYGGAIACTGLSAPTIRGCGFSANEVDGFGGAIYCEDSGPLIAGCVFSFNTALGQGGGAIYCNSSPAPTITDCVFYGNHGGSSGGAIYGQSSPVTATDCFFVGNTAGSGSTGVGGRSVSSTAHRWGSSPAARSPGTRRPWGASP